MVDGMTNRNGVYQYVTNESGLGEKDGMGMIEAILK
jgi:hypothetical protein